MKKLTEEDKEIIFEKLQEIFSCFDKMEDTKKFVDSTTDTIMNNHKEIKKIMEENKDLLENNI